MSVISGFEFSLTIIEPPLFMKRKEYIGEKRTKWRTHGNPLNIPLNTKWQFLTAKLRKSLNCSPEKPWNNCTEKNNWSRMILIVSWLGMLVKRDRWWLLSSGASQLDVLIREGLLISKLQPSLNANIWSFMLTLFSLFFFLIFSPLSLPSVNFRSHLVTRLWFLSPCFVPSCHFLIL